MLFHPSHTVKNPAANSLCSQARQGYGLPKRKSAGLAQFHLVRPAQIHPLCIAQPAAYSSPECVRSGSSLPSNTARRSTPTRLP